MKINILFFVLALMTNSSIIAQNAKEIAKNCLPSTVSLVMEDGYRQPISLGSGFIIENGKVVTNRHVVAEAKHGYALISGSSTKHKIQGYFDIDEENDLIILSVPTITGKSLTLNPNMPEIGEKIYAIGNPKGLSGTISEGIVSGIRNLSASELIQITAPISPGSSGGPVINNSGQVIGVAVGTFASGQNLNFAIPSSLLKNLLAKNGNTLIPLNITSSVTPLKTGNSEIDVNEGVSYRNPQFGFKLGFNSKSLMSFSLKNNLPHEVYNIHMLFIVYDRHGVPLDYFEKIFFENAYAHRDYYPNNLGIKPFLAKTIEISFKDANSSRALRMENDYDKFEVRILDYRIRED